MTRVAGSWPTGSSGAYRHMFFGPGLDLGPGDAAQDVGVVAHLERAETLVARVLRLERGLGSTVATDQGAGRGSHDGDSFSSFPRGLRGPELAPALRVRRHCFARCGCRGFVGPVPLPLWMRCSVVMREFTRTRGAIAGADVVRLTRRASARAAAAVGSAAARCLAGSRHRRAGRSRSATGVPSTTGEVSSSSRCSAPSRTVTKICSPVGAPAAGRRGAVDLEPGREDPVALGRLGAQRDRADWPAAARPGRSPVALARRDQGQLHAGQPGRGDDARGDHRDRPHRRCCGSPARP